MNSRTNRTKGHALKRGIRITRKGRAILRAIDRGTYKFSAKHGTTYKNGERTR